MINETAGRGILKYVYQTGDPDTEAKIHDAFNHMTQLCPDYWNYIRKVYVNNEPGGWLPYCTYLELPCFFQSTIYDFPIEFEDDFPFIDPIPHCDEAPVLFAERIHYDHKLEDLSDKEQYSGLISGMEWRVLDEPIRMYGFHYDGQKRLSQANYAHQEPMVGAELEGTDAFSTYYEYDVNGNITLLKRKGITNYDPSTGNYTYWDIDWLNMTYNNNRLENVTEPLAITQSHGYQSLGETFTYDDAGNVTYDGGKGANFTNYNALNLPTQVERITSTGTITGKVVNTYDASGTKWSTDHTYYNQGSQNQNIKYVNGLELLDNGQFVLHHEEGRYVSNSGESNYEYVISDHLGNGRVWFQDLDGDGDLSLDPANLEVKQVKHYYPFGMTMGIQSLQTYAPPIDRNQYNGIEFFEGLDYNMAFYRTLDPGIGRWLQVDPKAESFYGISPYAAMGNNPVSIVDPAGDEIFTAMLVGAAIGVIANGITNSVNGQHFFANAGMAAVMGAVGGAMAGGAAGIGTGMAKAGLSVGSSYLPGANIPLGENMSLSISPSLFLGSGGLGIGANFGVNYSSENFDIGANFGGTMWAEHMFTGGDFLEGRVGGGFGVGNENFKVGVGSTYFGGGGISQRLGHISAYGKEWSFMYENDWMFGTGLGDGNDRWRTTGINATVGEFSLGLNLATGDPGPPGDRQKLYSEGCGPNGTYWSGKADSYRLGSLTFGYRGINVGWNSEGIRNATQNYVHDKRGYSRFDVLHIPGGFQSHFKTRNPYTTW